MEDNMGPFAVYRCQVPSKQMERCGTYPTYKEAMQVYHDLCGAHHRDHVQVRDVPTGTLIAERRGMTA